MYSKASSGGAVEMVGDRSEKGKGYESKFGWRSEDR